METTNLAGTRIQARDRAISMLNRLTAGVAVGAFVAVGALAFTGAHTIPGVSSTSSGATASTATGSTPSTATGLTSSSTSASSGLQTPSGTLSASSGTGVAVTGGSR